MIAIAVLKRSSSVFSCKLIASVHLEPLYRALQEIIPGLDLNIMFVDLGIRHKILGCFTNRYFFDPHTWVEISALRRYMIEHADDHACLFEQQKRLWLINLLTRKTAVPIHRTGNVYDSYCKKFQVETQELCFPVNETNHHKVLILPDSRMKRKELPKRTVEHLCRSLLAKGHEVTTAFYKIKPYDVSGQTAIHLAFPELVSLIMDADHIITADSLPAHLAQLLQKSHEIHYPNAADHSWMTPFVREHHQYNIFR